MIRSLIRRAAVAVAVVLCATVAHAQTTLRFAYTHSTSDTHHAAALRFKERAEALTDGQVRIGLHPAGELGNDNQILEGVRLGTIDIAQAGNPFFTRLEPRLNVLDLPYLFVDEAHAHRVVDGPVGQSLLALLEAHRMRPLAFWEIGFRHVTNSKRPIRTPDDLRGLRIRTTPNPAHVQAFQLLGANPTPMAFTEVYLALETGTVDGQENPLPIIRSMRFHEVQKHLTLTRHAYTVSIVVMNPQRWGRLTAAQQQALVRAAGEAQSHQRELNQREASEALAAIRAAGVTVADQLDTGPFKAAVFEQVKGSFVAQHGPQLVDAIAAAR